MRTPLNLYLAITDYKRDPEARLNVPSLKRLAALMHEKLGWLDRPADVDAAVDQSFLPR